MDVLSFVVRPVLLTTVVKICVHYMNCVHLCYAKECKSYCLKVKENYFHFQVNWTFICTVLFYLTGLHSICHVPYATLLYLFLFYLFFSTMSSFVYLYSLYVHMVKLYLSVFERLLSVFNVNCMHQGSESNAISILCMYVLYMWKNWQ